ncbi:hypothetical protein M513_03300 [Trichuris suis]|uniref:C3H1-type domain-containing protein n=1 Tax=Trichuris suis TaxID=68888 RepID=A0A085MF65_9BILA|nr:hypothetical protein M513_03300 [Trichuris suis]
MAFQATVKALLIALIVFSVTEVLAKSKRSRSNAVYSRDYSKKHKPSIESHLPLNRTECTTTATDYLLGAEVKKISRRGKVRTLNVTRHLGRKVVALYFSAMWCRHSRCFTKTKCTYLHRASTRKLVAKVLKSFTSVKTA